MNLTSSDPFWRRAGLSRRALLSWVVPAAVLAAFVGGLAAAAQHEGVRAAGAPGMALYSLTSHTASMVLVGALAVSVAAMFARAGSRGCAFVVLAATASGPMTLVAAPVRASLIAADNLNTVPWWHVLVAAGLTAVLVGWTVAVVRSRPAAPQEVRVARFGSDSTALAVLAVVCFLAFLRESWESPESVGLLPHLGWALLAASLAVGVAHHPWRRRLPPASCPRPPWLRCTARTTATEGGPESPAGSSTAWNPRSSCPGPWPSWCC